MEKKVFAIAILLALALNLSCAQEIRFVKTMDNEEFPNNLIPSLARNVSYIHAVDTNSQPITYSIVSDYFTVNAQTGQIFLVAYLDTEPDIPTDFMDLKIKASTLKYSYQILNRIKIADVNDRAPELMSEKRTFEIIETNTYPVYLTNPDSSQVELHFHDPDPTNTEITVTCANTLSSPEVCSIFSLAKNLSKSTSRDYYGSIQAIKQLVYLERSVYQMVLIVTDNLANTRHVVLEVRVLPDLNRPPILSSDSSQFTIQEKQLKVIGELKLDDRYEQSLRSNAVFKLVLDPHELQTAFPASWASEVLDVDFKLISNFITINSENELQTINVVDRDSFQFSSHNGILKLWVKVHFKTSPAKANFYKISIFFSDLNDNRPSLALVNDNAPLGQFTPLAIDQQLHFQMNENEMGPIIFDVSNPANSLARALIAYDLDLAENATFAFVIGEDLSSQRRLVAEALNYYFNFGASFLNDTQCFFVISKTSVNLINVKALDYENLDLEPVYDPISGIGSKVVKFMIGAKECNTNEHFSSSMVPVSITVRDTNDNKPAFLKSTYFQRVDVTLSNHQQIMSFQVSDMDSGVYGVNGLRCALYGTDSDRFGVDSIKQIIYIKQGCTSSCTDYFKSLYYFNLVCRDDEGKGHVATTTVIISFQDSIEASCFSVPVTSYNLLATGSAGIDIPSLTIKVNNPNIQNKIQYEIQDSTMKKFFIIDMFGNFKIIAEKLTISDSPAKDGLFRIPVLVSSSSNAAQCTEIVTISVTLSRTLNQNNCPKISDAALCHFSINKTDFDSNRIRFCFYGTTQPVYNIDLPASSNNLFFAKIYYSLLPKSPDYLYINPYDGCVKISSVFNLDTSSIKHIQYSVGAFNPGYPDCMYTNQRSCLINILNPNLQQLKCANDFAISQNNTAFSLQVHNADVNAKLFYKIVKEERFHSSNGQSQLYQNNFMYKVNAITGLVEADFEAANAPYSSVLLTVEVSDIFQLTSSTNCFVEFRFNQQTSSRTPQIIGSSVRQEQICEDVPVSSFTIRLNAFDPSLTNQSLCFSLSQNEYFRLENNICDSLEFKPSIPDAAVILKRSLIGYNRQNQAGPQLTASLFYCHQSSKLNTQLITFTVLDVNKYAPQVVKPTSNVVLYPASNSKVMSSLPLDVYDQDQAPYNSFKCSVENDNRFVTFFDTFKQTVTINLLDPTVTSNEEHVDLSVKCCDDASRWSENKCFSVPKCSLNIIRVSLANLKVPVYCGNNEEFTVLSENAPISSTILNVNCFSNYTRNGITYSLLNAVEPRLFTVNRTTGAISVAQSLKFHGINEDQTLQVQCSNGQSSSVCMLDLRIVKDKPILPVWIYPNPEWFSGCVEIGQNVDMRHKSLVTEVQAYSPDLSNVDYWFVDKNRLRSYIYEFKIETTPSFGRIVLNENINRSVNLFREITLAATIKVGREQKVVTTYQYICIKIAAISNDVPCFQNTPDGSKWPYQTEVRHNNDQCFSDQLIKVVNKNHLQNQVYYYLIPPADKSAYDLFSRFEIDIIKGIVCYRNKQDNFNLIANIVHSSLSYTNPYVFNQVCINLNVIATESLMSEADRLAFVYSRNSCSANYFKVCTIKPDDNNPPMFLSTYDSTTKIIYLKKILTKQLSCLHQFEFSNSNSGDNYKYTLVSLTNANDYSIFYVNQTSRCLAVQQLTGPSAKPYLAGLHKLEITAEDQYNRTDSTFVSVYVIESCNQVLRAFISSNILRVQSNIHLYLAELGQLASQLLKKPIVALELGIYTDPTTQKSSNLLFENSVLEVAFYDVNMNVFLTDAQAEAMLDSNLGSINTQGLFINKIRSSCPSFSPASSILEKIAISLWAAILALLLFLVTLFLFFPLCYAFKLLKYRNNKIILKQSIVPIFEDCQSTCPVPLQQQHRQQQQQMSIDDDNQNQQMERGSQIYAMQYGGSSQNIDAIREDQQIYNKFNQELLQAIRQRPVLRGGNNNFTDESCEGNESTSDSANQNDN